MAALFPHAFSRRSLLAGAAGLATASLVGVDPSAQAATSRPTRMFWWGTATALKGGVHQGTTVDANGALRLSARQGTWQFKDPITGITRTYDYATWFSPWMVIGFPATEIIASWNAVCPAGTFVEIVAEVISPTEQRLGSYLVARWTSGDGATDIRRHSGQQSTAVATMKTDTLTALGATRFGKVRLRVRFARLTGSTVTPTVRGVGVVCSALPATSSLAASPKGVACGKAPLAVPAYSQMLHRGHFPQYGGGGAAWCSATSTAMVLDYWKVGPPATLTTWAQINGETRPQVDHVARCVYDYLYKGTGNWPFNPAYAAARGLRGYVTRLRSLHEAERFIAAGIPLIVSTIFTSTQLSGSGFSTSGHLMVIVGFTATGDVIVNDPASGMVASDAKVRRIYNRAQFENAWAGRAKGTTYVMAPYGRALPAVPTASEPNWL